MTNLLNSTPLNANLNVKQSCFSVIQIFSILRNKNLRCLTNSNFLSDGITIWVLAKLNGSSRRISSTEGKNLLKSNITDVLTVIDLLL